MKKFFLLSFIIFSFTSSFAQWQYPKTKTVDASDTYFGVNYKDPYRWLENVKEPEVETWFKQQAELTNSTMKNISGRDELIAEWTKLDKLDPPRYNSIDIENGRVFYKKRMPGESVAKLYFREGMNGEEHLLFDPLTFIKGKTLSVDGLPSHDGKKLIIYYSESGGEIQTIKVMDVDTRKFMPEEIYPSRFGPTCWTFDNSSFLYSSQKTNDFSTPEFQLHTKSKLHKLGDDVKNDVDFFSDERYPELGIEPNDLCFAAVSDICKDYILGDLSNTRPESHTFYAPISEFSSGHIKWKVLCKPEDGLVRGMGISGTKIFSVTYKNAPHYKLIATDLTNPDWTHARTVIPEKDEIIEFTTQSKDYLFVIYSNGINNRVFKVNLMTEKIDELTLPFSGTVNVSVPDSKTNLCRVGITSWIKPYTEFMYDADQNSFSATPFNKASIYPDAYTDLITDELEVKGHDGVMIPLTIIHKKGMKLDGSHPCMMESYGAYSIPMSPYFDIRMNSLAVKDVVVAYPHVRGGGEKGEAWYKAGYKTTKPNTWKDFNSCAEYLISHGYTSAKKLAGMGTSAGGILISRAITERPDLYASAICNVGCANTLRFEATPNGPANIPEFGTMKDSIESRALAEMDGVSHVTPGTKYPATMCVAGWNDPRVIAWQPGKFAAALQNSSTSEKPVLMKVNYDNGHFTEDRQVTFANFADQYSFALWQCGHPGFQMKK